MKRTLGIGSLCVAALSAQRTPPMPGQLIQGSGHRLHVDCRGSGPAVIFVNGVPRFSFDWILVQQEAAKFARACTWDRAGEAWSERAGEVTARGTVDDLAAVAAHADASSPVILVAHSAGGPIARVFAASHRDRVRALILVDTVPDNERMATMTDEFIDQSVERLKSTPRQGNPGLEPQFRKLPPDLQTAHSWATGKWWVEIGSRAAEGMRYQRGVAKLALEAGRKPYPLGDLRVIVIVRAKAADEDSDWIKQQRKLLNWSTNGRLELAVGSGHDIEVDAPETIVAAIRGVLAGANRP